MKLQEVELRALLTPAQKRSMQAFLENKEFRFVKKEKVRDAYFCATTVKNFSGVEMNEVGSFSLRVRESLINKKKVVELNTKVITRFGDHNAWDEHEVVVSGYEEMVAILVAIGFKQFFSLQKVRNVYKKSSLSVFFEDIKDFGACVEIEMMTTASKSDAAKEKIKGLLFELGVAEKQIVKKSVTNLLMRNRSKF